MVECGSNHHGMSAQPVNVRGQRTSARHGEKLSPGPGDLRCGVSSRTSSNIEPSALIYSCVGIKRGRDRSRPRCPALANHRILVTTNHTPGSKPESVPTALLDTKREDRQRECHHAIRPSQSAG